MDINERLYISCHVIEDKKHFVTDYVNNREMRNSFFEKYLPENQGLLTGLTEKIVLLKYCKDPQILSWFSEFLYHYFHTHNLKTSFRA